MIKAKVRARLSYSNVIATLALFIALGGAALAAGLPRHSVGSRQLKRGAVSAAALSRGAVTQSKLAQGSVVAGKLAPDSVSATSIGTGALTAGKLAPNAVTGGAIAPGVIDPGKLAPNAVTTPKISNGAVTLAKLGNEIAPLLGTLRAGQTLRGVFNLGTEATGSEDFISEGVSFFDPLASSPTINPALVAAGSSSNCPGLGGATQQTPSANPGNLCVYISAKTRSSTNARDRRSIPAWIWLRASSSGSGSFGFSGYWAVTAP